MERTVHNQDAIAWLSDQPVLVGCSFVTSLPDVSEISSLSLEQWKSWFVAAAVLVMGRCPDDGVSIFYQTDIKHAGVWVDKGYLVQKAAEQAGHSQLWHKIVCRRPPGNTGYGRPAYSHLICFSKSIKAQTSLSTSDVLPKAGEVTWTRGMGLEACRKACDFILSHTSTRTVVDPFCGHGTVLAVANDLGMNAIGVELGAKRARKARLLSTSEMGRDLLASSGHTP